MQMPRGQYANNSNSKFGSEQANLEYAMLSSMLNSQPSPSDSNHSGQGNTSLNTYNDPSTSAYDLSNFSQSPSNLTNSSSTYFGGYGSQNYAQPMPSPHLGNLPASSPFLQPGSSVMALNSGSNQSATLTTAYNQSPNMQMNTALPALPTTQSPAVPSDSNLPTAKPPVISASGAMKAEDVYNSITKPYPYAQSYHDLIRHLKDRSVATRCQSSKPEQCCFDSFDKMDILRIVRALAKFRPSLIALQMPLTEEDEIFVEKCFQRTLIVRYNARFAYQLI